VYCSVTGFGQTGPYAARAGYDAMIQGMSGIMDLTGDPAGEPQKIGVAFADIFTGVYGVVAIQAALAQRTRTGLGQHIDMALLDVMTSVLANQSLNFLVSGITPHRLGNAHPNIVPYQLFAAKNGRVMIAVGNDGQFRRLCGVLDLGMLAEDARYASNAGRVRDREALIAILSAAFAGWERDALLADVFADPQVEFRGMRVDLAAPEVLGGSVPSVRTPIVFSAAALALGRPSPRLGEHTAEIAHELGLRRPGAVAD
jgi:crotonobetainyl-CoA:carnitine CoA-transferase CaiB-like acyl-CoA transferase